MYRRPVSSAPTGFLAGYSGTGTDAGAERGEEVGIAGDGRKDSVGNRRVRVNRGSGLQPWRDRGAAGLPADGGRPYISFILPRCLEHERMHCHGRSALPRIALVPPVVHHLRKAPGGRP
ncbi:MAG: hypothetical protein BWY06_00918 [Candidatus Latescibacteria bacterium ADurb.Bin168]|nr:MAG: hypothetical protein BWY06_00918 [Candidatus Latescibacteria bacterium ADurb.Bin168]